MSNTTIEASINSLAEAFSAQINVIPTASEQIIKDLTPLLSADSALDPKITDALRNVVERFVETVKYTFVSSEHMSSGAVHACALLRETGAPPSVMRITLDGMTENFHCAHANAQDAMTNYSDLRKDVDEKIKEILSSYGPDAVLEISAKEGVEKNSLQNLSSSIIKHLEEAEKASSAVLSLLTTLKEHLDTFLEDETFSLTTPLSESRLWSAEMATTWSNLKTIFIRFNERLRVPVRKYSSWFKWYHANAKAMRDADAKARLPALTLPQFKLQIPKDPSSSQPEGKSFQPTPWLDGNLGPGRCSILLHDIDQTKPGTSSIKASVSITPSSSWSNYLKSIYIYFEVKQGGPPSSTRFTNYLPRNVKDISSDPTFQPQRCKPALRACISSRGELKWRFDRPFLKRHSTAAFPTNFDISFDLEHTIPLNLDCYVVFIYKQALTLFLTDTPQLYKTKFIAQPPPSPALSPNVGHTTETTTVLVSKKVNDIGAASSKQEVSS